MTISTLNAAQTFSDIIGCKPVGYIWEGGGGKPTYIQRISRFSTRHLPSEQALPEHIPGKACCRIID